MAPCPLLADCLGIALRRVSSGKRLTFTHEREAKLNEWMQENAFVTWLEADEPWIIERQMIEAVELPLNLRDAISAFRPTLAAVRAEAKQRARELPVVAG